MNSSLSKSTIIISLAVLLHCITVITGSVLRDPRTLELRDDEAEELTTVVDLDAESCLKQECNLGNFIADAIGYEYMLQNAPGSKMSGGFIVLVPGKRIGKSVNRSTELSDEIVESLVPFKDEILVKSVRGDVLLRILEKSVSDYTQNGGSSSFLQISKARVVFDFEKSGGDRLTSLRILSNDYQSMKSIEALATYEIVMPKFLADGNEGFDVLKGIKAEDLEKTELDATKSYIKQRSPVYPGIEERIILLNLDKAPKDDTGAAGAVKVSIFTVLSLVLLQILK